MRLRARVQGQPGRHRYASSPSRFETLRPFPHIPQLHHRPTIRSSPLHSSPSLPLQPVSIRDPLPYSATYVLSFGEQTSSGALPLASFGGRLYRLGKVRNVEEGAAATAARRDEVAVVV